MYIGTTHWDLCLQLHEYYEPDTPEYVPETIMMGESIRPTQSDERAHPPTKIDWEIGYYLHSHMRH
jgi:hypothetical protein